MLLPLDIGTLHLHRSTHADKYTCRGAPGRYTDIAVHPDSRLQDEEKKYKETTKGDAGGLLWEGESGKKCSTNAAACASYFVSFG